MALLPPSKNQMFSPHRQASFVPPMDASMLQPPSVATPAFVPETAQTPNPNYLRDIVSTYQNKQTAQKEQGSFIQNILSSRFQPNQTDYTTAYNRNTDALYAPNVFKATTPEEVAMNRVSLELTPYTMAMKVKENTPASVQEWNAYNAMSPADQQRYLEMKRNQQYLNLGDKYVSPSTGRELIKGLPPQDQPSIKGAQTAAEQSAKLEYAAPTAAATARGKISGETEAQAQSDLPRIIDNANYAIKKITELKNHPALDAVTGMRGMLPVIPGTEGADALARFKQISGQNFLEAYNTLKGGGQITEIEGQKATEAIARLDRAQDKATVQAAMDDLISVINSGVQRAQQKAGIQNMQPDQLPANPNAALGSVVNPPAAFDATGGGSGWSIKRVQ